MAVRLQRPASGGSNPSPEGSPPVASPPRGDSVSEAVAAASIGRTRSNVGTTVEANQLFTIDQFAQAIMESYPAPSFIKDTLFRNTESFWGESVAIDFYRGSARVAPFTTPYKRGIAIPRQRFRTKWTEAPHIKVTRDIRALDARYRMPGEPTIGSRGAAERIADLQTLDYDDLDLQIGRREELMCCQVLFDGKLVLVDGDDQTPLGEINFGPVNESVLGGPLWDQPDSDPLGDLRAMQRQVNSAGYPCDTYVLGRDAADAFLANESVKESSNFLNFRVGVVDAKTYTDYENWGVSIIGTLMGMGLVSYDAMFESPEDKMMHYYLPPNYVLLASSKSQNRFTYSRVSQVDSGDPPRVSDYNLPRVPQYVGDPTEDKILFRLWSRPLPVPVNTLTWTFAKVCSLRSTPILLPTP